jgi:hypothetical protein
MSSPPRPLALPRAKHEAFTRRLLELCSGGSPGARVTSGDDLLFIRDRLHERCAFFRLWPPPLQALICRLAAARCGAGGRGSDIALRKGLCRARPRSQPDVMLPVYGQATPSINPSGTR